MKVLFDHQCFSMQDYGGISRYHYHLIKEFEKQDDIEAKLSLEYSNNFYINNDGGFKVKNFFPGTKFYFKRTILDFINRGYTVKKLKKNNFDVFHPTYYNPYFLQYLGDKPFVITIHDLIHELYPVIINKIDKTIENRSYLLKCTKLIIADSFNTKKDLINIYGIPENKIDVVHLASSIDKSLSISSKNYSLPEKYFLYVGNRDFYKNFKNLLLAIEPLLRETPDLYLVTAGGGNFSKDEMKYFNSKKLQNKILFKKADDVTLATLYSHAIAFIFPSLYEGFGIPALEAMNCDCPVIMSNSSSLPEVGGDSVLYFDPANIQDIKEKVEQVLFNPEIRDNLIKKGVKQRAKFSFAKTAEQTKNVYYKLLNL